MITREQLKAEVDHVDDGNIEVLHQIILALAKKEVHSGIQPSSNTGNPLKGSVNFEKDIISPIGDEWSAAQ